jgi:hypothetical protein
LQEHVDIEHGCHGDDGADCGRCVGESRSTNAGVLAAQLCDRTYILQDSLEMGRLGQPPATPQQLPKISRLERFARTFVAITRVYEIIEATSILIINSWIRACRRTWNVTQVSHTRRK